MAHAATGTGEIFEWALWQLDQGTPVADVLSGLRAAFPEAAFTELVTAIETAQGAIAVGKALTAGEVLPEGGIAIPVVEGAPPGFTYEARITAYTKDGEYLAEYTVRHNSAAFLGSDQACDEITARASLAISPTPQQNDWFGVEKLQDQEAVFTCQITAVYAG